MKEGYKTVIISSVFVIGVAACETSGTTGQYDITQFRPTTAGAKLYDASLRMSELSKLSNDECLEACLL